MSEIKFDPSGESNLLFSIGGDILNLLLSYSDLMFLPYIINT